MSSPWQRRLVCPRLQVERKRKVALAADEFGVGDVDHEFVWAGAHRAERNDARVDDVAGHQLLNDCQLLSERTDWP